MLQMNLNSCLSSLEFMKSISTSQTVVQQDIMGWANIMQYEILLWNKQTTSTRKSCGNEEKWKYVQITDKNGFYSVS